MPANQDALRRYRIIHNRLKTGRKFKTSELVQACLNSDITASERTIQQDLKDLRDDIKLGFCLPIEKDTKTKTFYYSEIPKHFIPALELEAGEVKALLVYHKFVNQYKDYPIFEEISNAVKKVIDNANIPIDVKELFSKEGILETERHPPTDGIEFITDIMDSISSKRIIEIDYTKFGSSPKTYKIKPVLLKEDKRMWYVIGMDIKYGALKTFALDRLKGLHVTSEYFKEISFNSEEYFQYSFGITVSDEEPVEVVISFTPDQGNYLRTLPIHSTQKILKDAADEFLISIKVRPSYEFYSKIKSYGSQATVLSPPIVREIVHNCLKSAFSIYLEK